MVTREGDDDGDWVDIIMFGGVGSLSSEFLALKHESRILGHSSNHICGVSMVGQGRLCAVLPVEN